MPRTVRATGDQQILGGPGRALIISGQKTGATITAGVVTLYDNLTEGGTVIWSHRIDSETDMPLNIPLLARCLTGIFLGFDGTLANVAFTLTIDTK